MSPGIEETVALALYSPTKGAHVITAVGDYSGFVHWDLDKPAPDGNPKPPFLGNTHDVSGGELKRERDRPRRPPAREPGRSATPWMAGRPGRNRRRCPTPWPRQGTSPSPPTARTWVWTPNERVPYVTSDKGASWTACAGLPKDTRVVADRVNPKRFYGDRPVRRQVVRKRRRRGQVHGAAAGLAGWAAQTRRQRQRQSHRSRRRSRRPGPDLRHAGTARRSLAGGLRRPVPCPGGEGIRSHCLAWSRSTASASARRRPERKKDGKAAALYLVGTVQGQRGFFRSTDGGATWVRINDDQHQWGLVLHITGDPKKFGRVYVGTHGRGTFYGDPKGR